MPFSAERTDGKTVIRDANGTVLWSGTTDFAKDESANVTLTGALVDEADWPLYDAAQWEVLRRTGIYRTGFRDGEGGGTNNTPTNDPDKMFVSYSAVFTNDTPEFRVGLKWTNDVVLDIFAYGPLHQVISNVVTYTNNENIVVTYTNTTWHSLEPGLVGFSNNWEWVGFSTLTNGEETVFVDSNVPPERAVVRFYAAAPAVDTDGDGLNDGVEIFETRTSIYDRDSDHDGIEDGVERAAGSSPSTSNVWWVVTETNSFHWWKVLGTNIPSTPQYITNFPIAFNRPTSNSIVHDVRITGFVDDILCVDGNVVGGWNPGTTNFTNASVLSLATNAQSGCLDLEIWDFPDQSHVGMNEVKVGNSYSNPFNVVLEWWVPITMTINVTSSVASVSLNPPPFEGFREWPFDRTNSPYPDKHFVVFFNDATDFDPNMNFVTNDFDIVLSAVLSPDNYPVEDCTPHWHQIAGPESGELIETNEMTACFRNPRQGGVYQFSFNLGLQGVPNSEATVVLPLAGAEVDAIIQADLTPANTFASNVVANHWWITRQLPNSGLNWFVGYGNGDYLGRPDNSNAPTVRVYNQVNTTDMRGAGAVCTWKGYPVRVAKLSNFVVAYAARKIDVSGTAAWVAQSIGTWNDAAATKSWNAGWAVAGGTNYETEVSNLVRDIWDDGDEKNMRLWPNTNAADNYVPRVQGWNPDTQFTSPGFLQESNP